MENSLLLAGILGPILLAAGLSGWLNKGWFEKVLKDFIKSPALIHVGGYFSLAAGLILVMMHNVWEQEWYVLITILAWLTLLKGVGLTVFPDWYIEHVKKIDLKGNFMMIWTVVALVVGAYLSYLSYLV